MRIAFHSNQLSRQGTEIALYDYAVAAEELLGHRAVILHHRHNANNAPEAIDKFRRRFDVLAYDTLDGLDPLLQHAGAQLLYTIKAGRRDGVVSQVVPTMVHAVFPTAPRQAHGASFAFISEWLSAGCAMGDVPAVPHIVQLPNERSDLREALGLPPSALVLGGMGGAASFDIPAAVTGLHTALQARPDLWFVGLNLTPFLEHPRARFLEGTADLQHKTRFINSCDAMLHARAQGESFGLACGEFSIRNKPVITSSRGKHRHHLAVLGDAALLYDDAASLAALLQGLDREALARGQWDRYSQRYNAERVMEAFDRHLIQPALRNPHPAQPALVLGWRHQLAYLRFKLAMKRA
ncbi:MAG: hypothetical protein IBJ14_02400 [Hydrogenophaga sp.]|nr:hypothetical protein [Hydrogenophaga sp.]